jgi:predicted nucleic acid-binding protein
MILVDTSVWIEHLRKGSAELAQLLQNARVLTHPLIIGELACGNLRNRREVLSLLSALPMATSADQDEVLELIGAKRLMGQGVGWIDCNLLASALLSGVPLWTLDRKFRSMCTALGVLY